MGHRFRERRGDKGRLLPKLRRCSPRKQIALLVSCEAPQAPAQPVPQFGQHQALVGADGLALAQTVILGLVSPPTHGYGSGDVFEEPRDGVMVVFKLVDANEDAGEWCGRCHGQRRQLCTAEDWVQVSECVQGRG